MIDNVLVMQVQGLMRKFVAKNIIEHLDIIRFKKTNLADWKAKSDAVAMLQLCAYVKTTSADVKYSLK